MVFCNCCDKMFMDRLIKEDKVELIFHSSAYKHVNLVEKNPIQGLLNNILLKGKDKAEELANKTLKRVKSKLGFFDMKS